MRTRKVERKVEIVTSYKTTDGKIFSGTNAKRRAEERQGRLNFRLKLDQFDMFLRDLFSIKTEHNTDAEDEERVFCDQIMDEVGRYYAEDGDFKEEISGFLLDLYSFIGPDKWLQIHRFLTKK